MNVLAVEVSTSSAKAMVYSVNKGIRGVCSIPYRNSVNDVVSQDPEGVYRTLIECVRNVVEQVNCPIDVIGLGSTWHSLLFLDRHRNLWEDKNMGQYRSSSDSLSVPEE